MNPSSPAFSLGWQSKHLRSLAHYQRLIDQAFEAARAKAGSIAKGVDQLGVEDVKDLASYPRVKAPLDALLRDLQGDVQLTVLHGVRQQWDLANLKNDRLVQAAFGLKPNDPVPPHLQRYMHHSEEAMRAFASRRVNGLNLSDRVWKLTAQYRDSLEDALALMIDGAIPPEAFATEMRHFLKSPESLQQMLRNRLGIGYLSRDPKRLHPERGVYRSAYMNAKRLSVTETNMAYRVADQTRWETLDFVVGQEIHVSKNHTLNGLPFHDVCDELKGRYPKDFQFASWHPFCRCYCTPILKTAEELATDTERLLEGKEPLPHSESWVGETPAHFNSWLREHQEAIDRAAAKGTLPYFLRDNGEVNKGGWSVKAFRQPTKVKTIAEIAAERHAARTPEDVARILKQRRESLSTRKYGSKVAEALDGISDVDTQALRNALLRPDNKAILEVAAKLKATYKEIQRLTLLDNPMAVAKSFSLAEAKAVHSAVESKLVQMKSYVGGNLQAYKQKLEFEIDWVGKHKKYATWKVAQDAYKKELGIIIEQIEWQTVKHQNSQLLGYATKSKIYKNFLAEAEAAMAAGDLKKAKLALADAEAWKQKNEAKKAEAALKKIKKQLAETPLSKVKFADLPLLTHALSKMTMPTHTVVRRGVDDFRLPHSDKFLLDVKKGDTVIDYGFLSTSVHRDKGFKKSINLIIIIPEGAQGFYAEPFSHYTDSGKFDFGMHGPECL